MPRDASTSPPVLINLNIGGKHFQTTLTTLLRDKQSLLGQFFHLEFDPTSGTSKDSIKRQRFVIKVEDCSYFIDRDGEAFRYILNYLRSGTVVTPSSSSELKLLMDEAKFYRLLDLQSQLQKSTDLDLNGDAGQTSGQFITIGYRGTFGFGRDGQVDIKFRKLNRILVCGKIHICRVVFGDTLNESREPDRGGEDRYTCRLYLKHSSLEQAFDALAMKRFRLLTSCASGTCSTGDASTLPSPSGLGNPIPSRNSLDTEEAKWWHYNEFIFQREAN